jgi:hypothetical protein
MMMPALQGCQQRDGNNGNGCQGDVRKNASAAMATMPKRRQGDIPDDASAVRMPLPQQ